MIFFVFVSALCHWSFSYRSWLQVLPGEVEIPYVLGDHDHEAERVVIDGAVVHVAKLRIESCKEKNGQLSLYEPVGLNRKPEGTH